MQVLPSDEVTLILFLEGLEAGPEGFGVGPVDLGTDEGGILELGEVFDVGVVSGDLEAEELLLFCATFAFSWIFFLTVLSDSLIVSSSLCRVRDF